MTMQERTAANGDERRGRRVAVVTGGRRGIGRGCAFALAERGFDVSIVDVVHDDAAEETLRGICDRGQRGHHVTCDISDLAQHQSALQSITNALGPITCLVNNAGVQTQHRGDMLELPVDSLSRLLSVNVNGTFYFTQRVALMMRDNDPGIRSQPERSIIFISSANAAVAVTRQADYCVSKAALPMMVSLFALRLAEYGIAVHEVRPGMTQTDMTADVFEVYDEYVKAGAFPIARWGQPKDIGETIAHLADGSLPYSTGNVFYVDGGLHIHGA